MKLDRIENIRADGRAEGFVSGVLVAGVGVLIAGCIMFQCLFNRHTEEIKLLRDEVCAQRNVATDHEYSCKRYSEKLHQRHNAELQVMWWRLQELRDSRTPTIYNGAKCNK